MIGVTSGVYGAHPSGEVDLTALGATSQATFTHDLHGAQVAQLSLDLPVDANHPALSAHRMLTFWLAGWPVWRGVLAGPTRGSPWTLTASGLAGQATNYLAVFSTTPPPAGTAVTDALTQAVTRGLPWWWTGTIPEPFDSDTIPTQPGTIGDLLNLVSAATGQNWQVSNLGELTFTNPDITPVYQVNAVDAPGGITTVDFYTAVMAVYHPLSGGDPTVILPATTVTFRNSFWEDQGYVSERILDLTGYGPLDPTVVTTIGGQLLAAASPAPTFTGDVTVHRHHIRSYPGDVDVEPVTVQAARKCRFIGVQPAAASGVLDFAVSDDVTLGQVTYSVDDDTLMLSPTAPAARDLDTLVSDLLARRLQTPLTVSDL